jgi:hypothetical protein
MLSRYLECHIVVRVPHDSNGLVDALALKHAMADRGWWMSVLNVDESNEEKAGDLIFTTRDESSNIDIMKDRMLRALGYLKEFSLNVTRYKVEAAVIDSKQDDDLFPLKS